jgi:hypothetical protein
MTQQVDLWVDPACPWAWITSRWLLEVRAVRDVNVNFHVMSLAILNEGRDLSEEYVRLLDQTWGPVRTLIATEQRFGRPAVEALYSAMGARIHLLGEKDIDAMIRGALVDAELDPDLADTARVTDFDDALRQSHREGMEPVGLEVGTPVIHVGDNAFFGPVVTPAPKGDDAGRLYDAVMAVTGFDGFYELKRTRTKGPIFS